VDLDRPLDLSPAARHQDKSGTPVALIEQARRLDRLVVLDAVSSDDVVVEYPLGEPWREQTGCARFVELRGDAGGKRYALVREASRK
jgi:hypothetical protein